MNQGAFYTIVHGPDKNVVTAIVDGSLETTDSDNEHYFEIVGLLKEGRTEEAGKLMNLGKVILEKFKQLSERVSVRNGKIYFDGDEEHSVLTDHVLKFLREGEEDWKPLVAFMDKNAQNPQPESRKALYEWLVAGKLTITPEGNVIGYKGVDVRTDGIPRSTYSGGAYVDGEWVLGYIPYVPGTVVEMPRSEVVADPGMSCSKGLHVGTWDFASTFVSKGKTVAVEVSPRDVVSVPSHENTKMRVCRLRVIDFVDKPYDTALVDTSKQDARPAGLL